MSRDQVPKPEDWIRVQAHIRQLYVVEQKPLKEVSRILASQHGFHATHRMYKSRIQAWKFDKKFKETEWRQIIEIWRRRRDEEGKESIFKIRGRTVTSAKIRKFLKRKKIDEGEFLSSIEDSEPLPEIICWTPAASPTPHHLGRDSPSAASISDQEPNPTAAEPGPSSRMSWSEDWEEDQSRRSSSAIAGGLAGWTPDLTTTASTSSMYSQRRPSSHFGGALQVGPSQQTFTKRRSGSESSSSSTHVVYGIEGLALRSLTPDSVTLEEIDDVILCNLFRADRPPSFTGDSYHIHYPHSQEEIKCPMHTVPVKIVDSEIHLCRKNYPEMMSPRLRGQKDDDTLASRWLSRLFQACIFHNQQRGDLVNVNTRAAAEIFHTMLKTQSQYLLPSLSILTGILTAHNQWKLAADYLGECCQIAASTIGRDHPFTIAFEHMCGVCGFQEPNPVTAEHLNRAIVTFELAWAPSHPNTIVLKYYRAWDTLNQGNPAAAEQLLRAVLPLAERVMGRSNYVTTAIMRSLSRALHDQGQLSEAIHWMSEALTRQRKSLGAFHPERLEGIRRLAGYYERVGRLDTAELYFEQALSGQIKMLGINHGLTMGTLDQLSNVMKRQGKFAEEQTLQSKIDDLFRNDQTMQFETPAEAF